MQIRIDGSDVMRQHEFMMKVLIDSQEAVADKAKDVLVEEIRGDLQSKILRPNESGLKSAFGDARPKRQDERLVANITGQVEKHVGNTVIGVGDIEAMNTKVPYWRIQDEGGPVTAPAVPGYWVNNAGVRVAGDTSRMPGPGATSGDAFIYNPDSPTIMFVRSHIQPKNYFDSGERVARPKVMRLFERAFRSVWR